MYFLIVEYVDDVHQIIFYGYKIGIVVEYSAIQMVVFPEYFLQDEVELYVERH